MASPDLSSYVDLKIFDLSPQMIYDRAVDSLLLDMPAWVPREGNVEVLLLEALALEVSEVVTSINRVPSAVVEILLRLFGIVRDLGERPMVTLQFNLSDSNGHDIPIGSQVQVETPGVEPVVFTTLSSLVVPLGATTGTVSAIGDVYTDNANMLSVGSLLRILSRLVFVDTVVTASAVTGGRSPETGQEWFDRGIQRLQRLSSTLVMPAHFAVAALEQPEVKRAHALDNYDPATGPNPGDNPGHITVGVYGNNIALSGAEKTALDVIFEAAAQANLAVHVVDPTLNTVNVSVSLYKNSDQTAAAVQEAVTLALTDYLSPMRWPWTTVVRRNPLITYISNISGVAYVEALTVPAANVTLAGVLPLTWPGTLTVTVLNP